MHHATLGDAALAWWQSFGMQELSAAANQEHFQQVFLEVHVKPSASMKARAGLQTRTQAKQSVIAYAAENGSACLLAHQLSVEYKTSQERMHQSLSSITSNWFPR